MPEQLTLNNAVDQATKCAKDSVYFYVGLVSVATQKTEEQWQELRRQLETGLEGRREQAAEFVSRFEPTVKAADERLAAFEDRVAELASQLTERLPEPAAKVIDGALDAARQARAQAFELVLSSTPAGTSSAKPAKSSKSAKSAKKAA